MKSISGRGKVALACISGLLVILCGCQGLSNGNGTVTVTPPPPPPVNNGIKSINHIVFMAQENRSFDSYFGQLPAYWAANKIPNQQFDGLPVNASNPAYTGTTTPGTAQVPAFHLATSCIENLSPSWDESHEDWNLQFPGSSNPQMNGYVYNAAQYAIDENKGGAVPPFTDVNGYRAMGYYDGTDLPYYYFMASNFATSDRWFSPAMDRTQINRMYLFAATSQGYAYPPGTNSADAKALTAKTIFDALDTAGVSWKVYASDESCANGATGGDRPANELPHASSSGACTYLTQFQQFQTLPPNVVDVSEYLTDVQNGTLPSVAFIETGYLSGRDEHPSSGTNALVGAAYVASLINALMASPSWKDTVFILTYDEAGGTYDHVPPQPMLNPGDSAPIDLAPTDICAIPGGSNCDFNSTGFRLPLLVVSPFTKKNYVSHTVADYTAILKLIETRFKIPALTARDAQQMDMTEFFDFQNVPWATPPSNIPTQPTDSKPCNAASLGYPPAP